MNKAPFFPADSMQCYTPPVNDLPLQVYCTHTYFHKNKAQLETLLTWNSGIVLQMKVTTYDCIE